MIREKEELQSARKLPVSYKQHIVKHVICIGALILLVGSSSYGQHNSDIKILSCKTWGQPDFTKLESYLRKHGIHKTGARIREYDENIRSVIPGSSFRCYNNDVFLRWLLKDTTIYYDITLTNERQEVIFEVTSNQCGIKLPISELTQANSEIWVTVERHRNTSGFYWGIGFHLESLEPMDRQSIAAEIDRLGSDNTELIAFFLRQNLPLDALAILEHLVEDNRPQKQTAEDYWEIINDLHIESFQRR